jgi:hypothetical protein
VPPKSCLVTVTDIRGIQHRVEVTAESLYEAGVLGLSALKADGWTGDVGPSTRLEVQVREPAVIHTLSVQQIQRWLEGASISPGRAAQKVGQTPLGK